MQRLQIQRGSQTQDTIHRVVDENDTEAMMAIGQSWLRNERWDRDLWHQFSITAPNGYRLVEVNLA